MKILTFYPHTHPSEEPIKQTDREILEHRHTEETNRMAKNISGQLYFVLLDLKF